MPSHPVLDKRHSLEFGLSEDEILRLEKEDADPQALIVQGWWYWLQRNAHWSVAIGSSLVGEGEKRLPEVKDRYMRDLDAIREEYGEMGVNVDRAIALMMEHAPVGVDAEHAEFGANVVRDHVNTAELQAAMREAFILTLHGRGTHNF
jgi:pyrroloquinoline quinone (PQQ) biosynthesis protein C